MGSGSQMLGWVGLGEVGWVGREGESLVFQGAIEGRSWIRVQFCRSVTSSSGPYEGLMEAAVAARPGPQPVSEVPSIEFYGGVFGRITFTLLNCWSSTDTEAPAVNRNPSEYTACPGPWGGGKG